MVLSVIVALIFSPALTSTVLLQRREDGRHEPGWITRRFPAVGDGIHRASVWFNTGFERFVVRYRAIIVRVIERKWLALGVYALVCAALVIMFFRLPTGFLPTEDQGSAFVQFRLPPGASDTAMPAPGWPFT